MSKNKAHVAQNMKSKKKGITTRSAFNRVVLHSWKYYVARQEAFTLCSRYAPFREGTIADYTTNRF